MKRFKQWWHTRATVSGATLLGISVAAAVQQQPSLREWTLARYPTLSIGGDGSPATEFLRVAGVFRLTANRIAVVNGATNEIRFFDSAGKLVHTFGRTGSGPGEFRQIGWVGRARDTLFVADHSLSRISTIATGGDPELVRSTLLTAQGARGNFFAGGRLRDGRWLVLTYTSPGWDGPPGVHRLPASAGLIAAAADGRVSWLAERPGLAVFVHNPTGNIRQASVGATAFSPNFYAVAEGPFVWLADSDSDSLERVNASTAERRAIRLPLPSVPPSRALVAAARAREEALARSDRAREWVKAKFSATYLPRQVPRFEALLPGPAGELWVQQYSGNRADSTRYLVLDGELRPLAWVRAGAGFRVREVGIDYALGVHEDADGVETVRLYQLTRK
ncbi:MAG TPA: 6-bladed beta-propeller [Gemmatimonadaceae bacterium]|nr:6-bladed beta-propeller [Gemmatimonadaceae bacterium]